MDNEINREEMNKMNIVDLLKYVKESNIPGGITILIEKIVLEITKLQEEINARH